MRAFVATCIAGAVASNVDENEDYDVVARFLSGNDSNTTAAPTTAAPENTTEAPANTTQAAANTTAAPATTEAPANTTAAPTTTQAPVVGAWTAGHAHYQQYSDGNCTEVVQDNYWVGPTDGVCVFNDHVGQGWGTFPYSKWTVNAHNNGTAVDFFMANDCSGAAVYTIPQMPLGVCTPSSVPGKFYKIFHSTTPFTGHSTYHKFTDANCTIPMTSADAGATRWAGPTDNCIMANEVGFGNGLPVLNVTCNANSGVSGWDYSSGCGQAAGVHFDIPAGGCYPSSSGGYFLHTCMSFSGGYSYPPLTTTAAATTAAAETTAAAKTGNATTTSAAATEGNATTSAATNATQPPVTTSAPTNATTGNVTEGETVTFPPVAAVKITGSYAAEEDLPANVTSTELLASNNYVSAKQEGLATAIGVATSDVVITGFTVTVASSLRRGRRLATMNVETQYEVLVAESGAQTADQVAATLITTIASAGAAIQAATNTAMAAKDWSGEAVLTTVPQVTAAPVVATPVKAALTVLSTGVFSFTAYTDANCQTAGPSTASGNIGDCFDLDGGKAQVVGCNDNTLTMWVGSTCGAGLTTKNVITLSETCQPLGSESYVATCGPAPAAASSDAAAITAVSAIAASVLFL